MGKNREEQIRCYCSYCKEPIYYGKPYTKGEIGGTYHPDCYNQITTYSDEFGTSHTDEFGDPIDE